MSTVNEILKTLRDNMKLEKKEQWSSFEKLFKSNLAEVGKDYLLTEPPRKTETDHVRISNCLGICIAEEVRNIITFWNLDLTKPHLIWKALKDVFGEDEDKDLNEAVEKWNALHEMKMGKAEKFFEDLQKVKVQLSILGKDFGDDVFRAWTLAALPDELASLRMRSELQKEVLGKEK